MVASQGNRRVQEERGDRMTTQEVKKYYGDTPEQFAGFFAKVA